MNNSIYPCITLKGKVAEAADFYINTFGEGKILQTSPFVILIELYGQNFMLLNEGPSTTPNASVSFMVTTETPEETERYWDKLAEGGKIYMPLDSYPWSPKYGWVEDKYGVSWQLIFGNRQETTQKFCPSFMFTGANAGKAAEAIKFYTSLFPHSATIGIMEYNKEDGDMPGFIKHAQFTLNDYILTAMDSSAPHGVIFPDATSLVVNCDTQEEIDHYWEALTGKGGQEVACGWLTDRYGVSWQILPKVLMQLMKEPDRGERVMNAVMKMKKLIITDLENA